MAAAETRKWTFGQAGMRHSKQHWRTGALAGLGGGAATWLVAALLAQALDQDVWLQFTTLADMVLDQTTTIPAIVVGIALHLILATSSGVLFEWLVRHVPRRLGHDAPEIAGLLWGVALFAASYFVAMPLGAPQLLAISAPSWVIQYAVYGATLGLLYDLLRAR